MHPHRPIVGAPAPLSTTLLLAIAASVAAAQEPSKPPANARPTALADAFRQALARMRADKAPGLVFVLPPAGAKADPEVAARLQKEIARGKFGGSDETRIELNTARDVMLAQLQALRASRTPEVTALMLLCVPIVAEPAVAGAKPGETLVLLSATGERVTGATAALDDHAAVLDALAPFVLARKVVEPRRANVPPALAKLAARRSALLQLVKERQQRGEGLDGAEVQELHAIQQELADKMTVAAPAVVELHGERATLGGEGVPWTPPFEPAIPFGTETHQQWDPCPPCGMMATPLPMRSTLKLLAQ
jgi:hypothetical protein